MPGPRAINRMRLDGAKTAAYDPNAYTTQLSEAEQPRYADWLNEVSTALGRDVSGDQDYDMQGAFKAGVQAAANGHFDDQFKKPNHMTFSTDSRYSGREFTGGTWKKQDGRWAFHASPDNMKFHSRDELISYFRRAEPDSLLYLPGEDAPAFSPKSTNPRRY